MDKSPEELRSEIDDIREDLGGTLEAVGDRVAPKKVVARAKADLVDKVDDVKEKVNPARLARRGTDAVRQGVWSVVGNHGVSDAGVGGGGGGKLPAATDTTKSQNRALAARAGSTASSVVDDVRDIPGGARSKAQGNPIAAGLLAFAGGFFAAALLPPTEKEKDLTDKAKAKLEPLTKSVTEAGNNIAGELQSSAQKSLEKVKETAAEATEEVRGTAESSVGVVKGQATDSTETVTKQAKSATDRVKRQAKGSTAAVKEEAKGATGEVRAKAKAKRAASTAKHPGAGSTRPGGVTRSSVPGAVTVPRSSRVASPSGVRSR